MGQGSSGKRNANCNRAKKNPETVEISGFSVMRDQFRYMLKIGKIES